MKTQKGISTFFAILTVGIIAIIGFTILYSYQYIWTTEEGITVPRIKMSEEEKAKQALISFFDYLNNQKYDKADSLYGWGEAEEAERYLLGLYERSSGDGVEAFRIFCEHEIADNMVLDPACLLKVKILETEKLAEEQYEFTIQFLKDDGEVYIYACCGIPESEGSREFEYKVKKINGVYKVITPPIFIP